MITVYRIANCNYINDLSGTGAAINGGRWNSEGVYMLYTSSNASLALLEILANFHGFPYRYEYCRLKLLIPGEHILEYNAGMLPSNWVEFPPPLALQHIGDRFIAEHKYLALKVPSAVEPEEWNYLLNPAHADFKKIIIEEQKVLSIDKRLTRYADK